VVDAETIDLMIQVTSALRETHGGTCFSLLPSGECRIEVPAGHMGMFYLRPLNDGRFVVSCSKPLTSFVLLPRDTDPIAIAREFRRLAPATCHYRLPNEPSEVGA